MKKDNKKAPFRVLFLFLVCLFQRFDDGFIEVQEEDHGTGHAHDLGDGEGPPDIGDFAGLGQEPCDRQQDDQLSAQGDDQGVDTL